MPEETILIIFDYLWVLILLTMPINAVIYRIRARKYIEADSSLTPGYNKIALYIGLVGTIPFAFMSYELYALGVAAMPHFIEFNVENKAVVGMWLSLAVIELALVRWLFFRSGADILERHPGLIMASFQSWEDGFNKAWVYKVILILVILSQLAVLFMAPFFDLSMFTALKQS